METFNTETFNTEVTNPTSSFNNNNIENFNIDETNIVLSFNDNNEENQENKECIMCYEDHNNYKNIGRTCKCNFVICDLCIFECINNFTDCPMCKTPIILDHVYYDLTGQEFNKKMNYKKRTIDIITQNTFDSENQNHPFINELIKFVVENNILESFKKQNLNNSRSRERYNSSDYCDLQDILRNRTDDNFVTVSDFENFLESRGKDLNGEERQHYDVDDVDDFIEEIALNKSLDLLIKQKNKNETKKSSSEVSTENITSENSYNKPKFSLIKMMIDFFKN